MRNRSSRISASIATAITRHAYETDADNNTNTDDATTSRRGCPDPQTVLRPLVGFFAVFELVLVRFRWRDFLRLRHEVWEVDEEEYLASFGHRRERGTEGGELIPVGDLGYSGSTFFTTANGKFLVKALPRRSEYVFFTRDLVAPYMAHMAAHPASLLVRITDLLRAPRPSLGGVTGAAPTHHIVMENLLFGKDEGWEMYDLKPKDYFFPERDVAGGMLASEEVRERLVDEFPGRVVVDGAVRRELMGLLEEDTRLLADHDAVDYSLFLVRLPCSNNALSSNSHENPSSSPPHTAGPGVLSWRTGVDDAAGEWTYRAVVLDFFWAKRQVHAKAMTALVNGFNAVAARKGPMSITAEPGEYRDRFLSMVRSIVVEEGGR